MDASQKEKKEEQVNRDPVLADSAPSGPLLDEAGLRTKVNKFDNVTPNV